MVVRTSRWQRWLVFCLSLVVVVLVLELAARTFSWSKGKGFWTRPYAFESAFFVTCDWPPPLIENDRGRFRSGQVVPRKKTTGELRVICLGGSTTVNARNAEGLSYAGELQKRLRGDFPGHELLVLNAGADAFSTAHSLVNLSLRLIDFEPDVITVLHNINDLTVREFGEQMEPDYSNKYLDDFFLAYRHRGGFCGTVFRISRGAQLLKWRFTLLKRTLEPSSRGSGVRDPERGSALFQRNLRSIVVLARAHGIRPILVTQAHSDIEFEAEGGDFQRFNDVTRALGTELDVPVADVAIALSGRRELFLDPVHLTSDGVRAVADVMSPSVEAELVQVLSTSPLSEND